MNTEERVLAALQCKEPDMVPVFVHLNPYVSEWGGLGLVGGRAKDNSYEEVLEATKEFADVIYDWGYPCGRFKSWVDRGSSGFFFGSAYDVQVRHETVDVDTTRYTVRTPRGELSHTVKVRQGVAWCVEEFIKEPADVDKLLSIPYTPCRPDVSEFFGKAELLEDIAVAEVVLADPLLAVWDFVNLETLAIWTIKQRELLTEMLDICFERLMDQLDYLLGNDVGPLYYFNGAELALPPIMSPRDFDQFVAHYYARLVKKVHEHGKRVIVHCHGAVSRFLDRFLEMGADGLHPLESPPLGDVILADAKRRVGDKMCLIGNIRYMDLLYWSEAEIERAVIDCIRDAAHGGGFILDIDVYPYEPTISQKTAENLIHYMRLGRRYGGYPIDC